MKKGDRVLLAWASANRDPELFENPDELDIERWPNRHTAFGIGVHRCAGSHLGRAMARELLSQIINRMGDYVVDLDALEPLPAPGHQQRLDSDPGDVHAGPRILPADADAPATLLSRHAMTEDQYDVVVLGTGAAGLTRGPGRCARRAPASGCSRRPTRSAAPRPSRAPWCGCPHNRYAREAGVADSRQEGLAYLASLSHGMILPELAEAFVDTGRELLDWLEADDAGALPARARASPTTTPSTPAGSRPAAARIEPGLFSFDAVPGWADRVAGDTAPHERLRHPDRRRHRGRSTPTSWPEREARRARGARPRPRGQPARGLPRAGRRAA